MPETSDVLGMGMLLALLNDGRIDMKVNLT